MLVNVKIKWFWTDFIKFDKKIINIVACVKYF